MLDWLFKAFATKPTQETERKKQDDGFTPLLIPPAGAPGDIPVGGEFGTDGGGGDGGGGDGC